MRMNQEERRFDFHGLGAALKRASTKKCLSPAKRNLEESIMSIVVNIYYSGENGSARKFAKEMISSGTVDAIRNEEGNIRYDYFFPLGDEETVLLIDSWENQESIDFHHQSPMMNKIAELRDKYNLHMKVERYRSEDTIPDTDQKYIRN